MISVTVMIVAICCVCLLQVCFVTVVLIMVFALVFAACIYREILYLKCNIYELLSINGSRVTSAVNSLEANEVIAKVSHENEVFILSLC